MKIKIKDKTGITLNTSQKYCRENIKVVIDQEAIKDLKPENIMNGTSILGIDGTSNAIRTSGTAAANTILKGKTAYIDGEKVVGTLDMTSYEDEFTGDGELITNFIVLFNTQGVCTAPPSLLGVTKLPTQLPELNLSDYTFNGWFLDENFTQQAVANTTINADTILYAKLIANFSTGLKVNNDVTELRGIGSCIDTAIICPPTIKTIGQEAFASKSLSGSSITSFKMGKNLVTIGKSAFYNCTKLTSLTAPANGKLQTIESYAFQNCIKLRTVYIPKSVLYIAPSAFTQCITISDVYYEGSESDWQNIIIKEGNEILGSEATTIHYNSTF